MCVCVRACVCVCVCVCMTWGAKTPHICAHAHNISPLFMKFEMTFSVDIESQVSLILFREFYKD